MSISVVLGSQRGSPCKLNNLRVNRVKVGFICQPWESGGPPHPGGSIGLLTWELARRLAQSCGVVVCGLHSEDQAADECVDGVQFHRFGLGLDQWVLDRPRRLRGPLDNSRKDIDSLLYCALYALRCAKRLHAEGCDIIHLHNFSQFLPIVRMLNPRAKLVLHMNCDWLVQFERKVIGRRLRHADAIIGCSEYITDKVRKRFPQYADRCATVYNGADVGAFTDQTGGRRGGKHFIFVGRVSPEKGVHVLLEAFKNVAAEMPDVELTVVGGADIPPISFIVEPSRDPLVRGLRSFYKSTYMKNLQNKAATIATKVSFIGFVAHSELGNFFNAADIFVHPCVWGEPLGMSVIEAMAAGLPVIASRTGGLRESVVEAETGLLVEPNDVEALAAAMLRLASHQKMSLDMGTAGARRARERFSWDVVVARLLSLYRAMESGLPFPELSPLPKRCGLTYTAA